MARVAIRLSGLHKHNLGLKQCLLAFPWAFLCGTRPAPLSVTLALLGSATTNVHAIARLSPVLSMACLEPSFIPIVCRQAYMVHMLPNAPRGPLLCSEGWAELVWASALSSTASTASPWRASLKKCCRPCTNPWQGINEPPKIHLWLLSQDDSRKSGQLEAVSVISPFIQQFLVSSNT